jgi:uncharacterized membrane protein YdbT with pleckstrin-like domain
MKKLQPIIKEKIIFKTRPHWLIILTPEVVLTTLGVLIIRYLRTILPGQMPGVRRLHVLFSASWCFMMIIILFDWICTGYSLTNLRLIEERGIIGRRMVSIGLDRVQDVTCKFGFWGQVFGFGDIEIESAGTYGNIIFRFIPSPLKRWGEMEGIIFAFRRSGL